MFSAINKAFSYFWTQDEEDGITEEANHLGDDDSQDYDDVQANPDGIELSNGDIVTTKHIEGKISHLFETHGLIDGEIYFSLDKVLSPIAPQYGDKVNVVAKQQHDLGGWFAEKVTIATNWEEEEKEGEEIVRSSVVGVVTEYNATRSCGVINDRYSFKSDDVEGGYSPRVGDYVTLDTSWSGGSVDVHNIKPLRRQEREGHVTAAQRDHGYIDGEIFFSYDVCTTDYYPRKHDKVKVVAIESGQGKCSWRAISVSPVANKPSPSNIQASTVSSPTRSSFIENLLKSKGNITVTTDTDFKHVDLGKTKKKTIWLHNQGEEVHTVQRVHLPADNPQFHITGDIKVFEKGNHVGTFTEAEAQRLGPGMSCSIHVTLEARMPGYDKQLLIITFDKFSIGRYLTVVVTDPLQELIIKGPTYNKSQNLRGHAYRRYKDSQMSGEKWIVPGERPEFKFARPLCLPKRLPRYQVPDTLRLCIQDGLNLLESFPEITQELTPENYAKKFQTLLHMEEIQMDIDIREFDLDRVYMRPVGEYLGLQVPGLAEGRPSLLIGDRVMASSPADPDGPVYEGYIHEVFNEEILLKFNKDFHQSYNGKDFDMQFTFNRTPLRRSHQAVQFAANLGQNVLFPEKLQPKISQLKRAPVHHQYLVPAKSVHDQPSTSSLNYFNRKLNSRQKAAVNRVLQGHSRPLPYVVFGPPGTGKTITVVESILQVLTNIPHSRILACTPSNSAADLIAERLHESGILKTSDMIRLNAAQRNEQLISESIQPYCSSGDNLDLTSRYRIIVCTCITAGLLYSLGLKEGHFSHVFVDEAGQATEAECMIPACMVAGSEGQIILAGDPYQLGPVLRSRYSQFYGLQCSYLERLVERPLYSRNVMAFADHGCYDPLLVTKLIENYRSHQNILCLSSKLFYNNELVVQGDPKLTHSLCNWEVLPNPTFPVIFHGIRGEDVREGDSPSWFNPAEIVQVIKYLQQLTKDEALNLSADDIGVITPYRKQVQKIRLLIEKLGIPSVKVGSVEEFQGQERQVIIMSTVRSNEEILSFDRKHSLGFLSNPKRFNVAITRAQALLIVIGNPHVLTMDNYWQLLIQYCVDNGAYIGCDLPEFHT